MKAKNVIPVFCWLFGVAVIATINACSTHSDVSPTVQPTQAQILVEAGEWVTVGGTLVQDDGTSITLNGNDPFLKTILLYNVTFYADGTAVDTNDPGGLTQNGLTWKLTGTHLLVRPNANNTDRVDAVITELGYYKLVLKASDFYLYNGVTYTTLIQTFAH